MRWLCQPTIDLLTTEFTKEFSVAQWLEHPTSVRKLVGSIPIWNSEFFSVFFSPHTSFHLLLLLFVYFLKTVCVCLFVSV